MNIYNIEQDIEEEQRSCVVTKRNEIYGNESKIYENEE